jgi:hypothetical protein
MTSPREQAAVKNNDLHFYSWGSPETSARKKENRERYNEFKNEISTALGFSNLIQNSLKIRPKHTF